MRTVASLVISYFLLVVGVSNSLSKVWGDAIQESALLLSRLSAFRSRVGSRLSLEEGIERTERVYRASLQRTPLPTAVPRVFESGDIHVSVEEPPGLPVDVEGAHALQQRLQHQRISAAQAQARGAKYDGQTQYSPPPMNPSQRVAATVGLLVARVRALPLLRIHGIGVTEDYQGRVAHWANNVTLEQLLATAPGWPYSLTLNRQGAGYLGKVGAGGAKDKAQLFLPPEEDYEEDSSSTSFLGLAYRKKGGGAVEGGTGAPTQTPLRPHEEDINLYSGGPSRASLFLSTVPLLRELARGDSAQRGSERRGKLPRGSPPLGSDFSQAASRPGDGGVLLDPDAPGMPLSQRPPLNPSRTHRYGILTPLSIAHTREEAKVAALVRLLQAMGLLAAPFRAVWECFALMVKALTGVSANRMVELGSLAGWNFMGRVLDGFEQVAWRAAGGLGWEGRAESVAQVYNEAKFFVRRWLAGAGEAVRWALGVVWGTGRELFASVFPELDMGYHRAEVTALRMVLAHVASLEGALMGHMKIGAKFLEQGE